MYDGCIGMFTRCTTGVLSCSHRHKTLAHVDSFGPHCLSHRDAAQGAARCWKLPKNILCWMFKILRSQWFGKFWVLLVSTPKHGLTLEEKCPPHNLTQNFIPKEETCLKRAHCDFFYFDICWQIDLEIIRESLKELWGFNLTSWTYVLIHIFLLQFHLWNGMTMIAHFLANW